MNYEQLAASAPKWRSALEKGLIENGGHDLVVPYDHVAHAFPSNMPNPRSFDQPLIEQGQLMAWARIQGWGVQLTEAVAGDACRPDVRFIKKSSTANE